MNINKYLCFLWSHKIFTYVSVNEKASSGLIQEGSGSEEKNELAFIIMICSGVAVAILLAGFLWNQYKITLIIPG